MIETLKQIKLNKEIKLKRLLLSLSIIALLTTAAQAQVFTTFEEDQLTKDANLIVKLSDDGINVLNKDHAKAFELIWNNSKYTPQEIFDKFGASSYKLFVNSQKTQEFLATTIVDYEALVPPCDFTINADGTVTVGVCVEPVVEDATVVVE